MTREEIEFLFRTHYVKMFRLAVSILCDEEEGKDVVSEVFGHLIDNNIVLREDTAEAYLLAGVRNRCRNVLERKQVRERYVRLAPAGEGQQEPSPEERLMMSELMEYVRENLLPLNQQVFRLRFLEEMTCQEVADALGVSRQTVHSHLRQAIEKIRGFFRSEK